ncbi:MAG: dihydrofolate reductase [Bacteroidia bacterium]|nr:dihydrofolate reductase [Bacteroidia bacterium]
MKISIIVAVAENGVIGKDNRLIWRLPDDMKFFKEKTQGHHVITGRRNYESIPEKFRPLPGRINLVVSRSETYTAPGAQVFHSIEEAIEYAAGRGEEECFIIGGGEVYRQCLSRANRVYLTRVHGRPDGDTYFEFPVPGFRRISATAHPTDEKHVMAFTIEVWELQ